MSVLRSAHRRRSLAAGVAALLAAATLVAVNAPSAGALVGPLPNVQDFEGSGVVTTTYPGVFPFGDSAASTPALQIVDAPDVPGEGDGNHALDVPYTVGSYGGFSDDLAQSQDWTSYAGFSFWVKEGDTGKSIEYEIKDGGADAEHSELWQGFFTDDHSGWTHITEPFADFVKRKDYQPTGAPSDGVLNLTNMWGFAVNLPGNASGDLQFDDVALEGVAQPRVAAQRSTYLVNAGKTAHVGVTLTTADGKPLASDVSVAYSTADQTAQAGTDYTAAQGTLVFKAGTKSGTTQDVNVMTAAATAPSTAKTATVHLTATGATQSGPDPLVVINAHGYAYLDKSKPVVTRVKDLMNQMTLQDKIGQMTQAERAAVGDGTDITKYRLGSLLSGGGSVPSPNTAAGWAAMIDGFQDQALATPLQIPMIYGIDSVHGDNNLAGATLFPHNIGMGATRDPALVQQEGVVAATETRATGIPWAFSACICVARDDRWGRTYESFGEDPSLVTDMTTIFKGLQGNGHLARKTSVLATAKHFLGDGNTRYGSSTTSNYQIDQGIAYVSPKELNALLQPYKAAVKDGVGSVMPSYSSLKIEGKDAKPIKMHARKDMITGVLKKKLGFKGFVISDYAAIDEISPDYKSDVETGVNAGLDMVMVPNDYTTFISDLTDLVNSNDVTMSRINDAVSRILTEKFRLGLFDHPFANTSEAKTIGDHAHRQVARKAAAESQVLLKNSGHVLPLSSGEKVYVAGSNADDEGDQTGGWTLTWQGQSGAIPGATSILAGLRQDAPSDTITYSKKATAPKTGYDVGVVVVGEDTPYAEGMGDIGVNDHTFQLSTADRQAIDSVCRAMKCVVLVVSGRPMDITGIVPKADAVVASWLPGSEGEGVADALTGLRRFTGRLPDSWAKSESQQPINVGDKQYNPLYPYGWGLRTDPTRRRLVVLRREMQADGHAAAVRDLDRVLVRSNWSGSTVRRPMDVLAALTRAGSRFGESWFGFAQRDALVSVARDIVQNRIVHGEAGAMTRTSPLTANAEHQLMAGHPGAAVHLLTQAYRSV